MQKGQIESKLNGNVSDNEIVGLQDELDVMINDFE